MSETGTSLRKLRDSLSSGALPLWSPDSQRFATAPERPKHDRTPTIVIGQATSDSVRAVTGLSDHPSHETKVKLLGWSPDGARLLYELDDYGPRGAYDRGLVISLFAIDDDGKGRTRLADGFTNGYGPVQLGGAAWAPNGRRIAYARCAQDECDIWIVGSNGRHRQRLITGKTLSWDSLAWLQDNAIVLADARGLVRVQVSSRAERLLAPFTAEGEHFFVGRSTDGRVIGLSGYVSPPRFVVATTDGLSSRIYQSPRPMKGSVSPGRAFSVHLD
jgi:Tol biopolymer transport system component